MKTILLNLVIFSSLMLGFSACDDNDESVNLKVTAVKELYEPANGKTIVLQPSASASLYFEWEPARAADGGMVLYELAFDVEGGDFSTPIYRMPSDNNGGYHNATVSHALLNKICGFAGIESSATGKIIWTVFSTKGVNGVKAEGYRTLQITRLSGFAELPVDVYVTGEATEVGATLANAQVMKAVANGEFEIYTQLTAGKTYRFTDGKAGAPRQFYVDNGVLKEGNSECTVETTGVYRIKLDFNSGSSVYTRVTDIQLYFCPTDAFLFSTTYQGHGIWKAFNRPITFKQESWGRDERYKIMMTTVNSAGETVEEWWGTPNTDSRPNADSPASYYFLYPVDNSQWNGKFKFASEMDNSLVDFTVFLQAENSYTHSIVKVGNQ